MQSVSVPTFFRSPKSPEEAIRQCLIVERATTLFTSGYDWYQSDTNPFLFGVCGPNGQHYIVNMQANACTCKSFLRDGDCKHRLAVALSQECADAALCQQAQETFDVCRSDRFDREVRETGFLCY